LNSFGSYKKPLLPLLLLLHTVGALESVDAREELREELREGGHQP